MAMQLVSSQLGFPEVVDISKNKANLQVSNMGKPNRNGFFRSLWNTYVH